MHACGAKIALEERKNEVLPDQLEQVQIFHSRCE